MSGKPRPGGILYLLVSIVALLSLESPSSAYLVITTGSGKEIKWEVPSASYLLNTSDGPSGSLEAIQAAMQTWSDVPASSFVFVYAGTTPSTSHGDNDGQNIVTFGRMGSNGTLAENVFWYDGATGHLLDSDIRINTSYSWSASGSPGDYDVQNIATHELGHSLSLDDLYDAADSEKTMYGYASLGETKKRTLDPDDMAGIAHLYPGGSAAGDFDGDGRTDIAVWRPSEGQWWILNSFNGSLTQRQWGTSGDVPVPGDFDGDGKADIAVWRPSEGQWWILNSSDGSLTQRQWGASGDTTVPGDYDGDGETDIAVWRPSEGQWWILNSSDGSVTQRQWGTSGDVPVMSLY